MSDTSGRTSQPSAGGAAALRERLAQSRAALLEALANLTERDFASELEDGRSVLGLLAALAPAELDAAATVSGGAGGGAARNRREAMMAPQIMHDLAGARRRTLLALETAGAGGSGEGDPLAALRAVAEREEQAAAAIRARFGATAEGGA